MDDIKVKVKVATWNILSDGLYEGEFLTPDGDDKTLVWGARKKKIYECLANFFNNGGDIFATQENDRPNDILKGVQAMCPQLALPEKEHAIKHVICLKHKKESTGKKLAATRGLQGGINDTITVYYNSQNVSLEPNIKADPPPELMGDPDDLDKLNQNPNLQSKSSQINLDSELAAMLTFKKKENTFVVVNAHLKSGENAEAADKRSTQMLKIFNTLKSINIPTIILMDSNSSKHYPSSSNMLDERNNANEELKMIYKDRFVNIVDDNEGDGFECFKMRHGAGGQPNKYGELMFDTIDKILISADNIKQVGDLNIISSFTPWHNNKCNLDRRKDEDHIYKLRTNKYLRYAIKACVFGAENLSNIYMDKKGKAIRLDDNNFEITHGEEFKQLLERELKKELKDDERNEKSSYNNDLNFSTLGAWNAKTLVKAVKQTFDTSTGENEQIRGQTTIPNKTCHIKNILDKSGSTDEVGLNKALEIAKASPLFPENIKNRMYPNMGAPSDHPPIEATLKLNFPKSSNQATTTTASASASYAPSSASASDAPASSRSYANVVAGMGGGSKKRKKRRHRVSKRGRKVKVSRRGRKVSKKRRKLKRVSNKGLRM